MENGETPELAAIREIAEETGLRINEDNLELIEINTHSHTYANGDQAMFTSYRFITRFDYVPELSLDNESVGAIMVTHTILSHQQDFIKKCLAMRKRTD